MTLKIAVVTEDGQTISRHFGRAPYFLVVTVEDDQIVNREMRPKPGHGQFHGEHHGPPHEEGGRGRGFGSAAQERHKRMAEIIADCSLVLAGGMGLGAYQNFQERGIRPLVTDIVSVDEALKAYLEGRLVERSERLH